MATSAADPSVAAPVRFAQRLTVRQHPARALQRLGHDVRIDAPSGRALDLARVGRTAVRADVPALPAVQRRGRPGEPDLPDVITPAVLALPAPASPSSEPFPSATIEATPSGPGSASSPVLIAPSVPSPVPAPLVGDAAPLAADTTPIAATATPAGATAAAAAAAVQRASLGSVTTPLPAPRALTTTTTSAAGVAGRGPVEIGARTLAPAPAGEPAIAGLPLLAPIGQRAASAAAPAILPATASASPEPATTPEPATPEADVAPLVGSMSMTDATPDAADTSHPPEVSDPFERPLQRRGIGAPIDAVPRRVQRTRLDEPLPAPTPFETAARAADARPTVVPLTPATTAPSPALLPVARAVAPALSADAGSGDDVSASAASVVAAVSAPMAPLVGDVPLAAPAVQTLVTMPSATDVDGPFTDVSSDRGPAETRVPTVGGVPLPDHLAALIPTSAASANLGSTVQRSVAPSTITPVPPPASMTASPAPSFAVPLRRLPVGDAIPVLRSSTSLSTSPTSSPALPGMSPGRIDRPMATSARPVQASAFGAPPSAPATVATTYASASATTEAALATGLGTLDADGSVVFAPPAVQRAVSSTPSSVPVAREVATEPIAAATPAGTGAAAGPDLDKMAEDLYERMRPMLTRELLLDRERSSTLLDL